MAAHPVTPGFRGRAKRLLRATAEALVLPLVLGYRLSAALAPGRARATFQGYSQFLSLWPGTTGNFLRRAFYRHTLKRCSRNCVISFGTIFSTPEAEIGENVYVGARCTIGLVTLGDDVLLGSNVDLLSGKRQHHIDRLDVPIRLQGGTFERVTIGSDVWIGNGAAVAADVASQSIVAMGSVVVSPVPPRSIVGGNPARVLRERGASPAPARESVVTA